MSCLHLHFPQRRFYIWTISRKFASGYLDSADLVSDNMDTADLVSGNLDSADLVSGNLDSADLVSDNLDSGNLTTLCFNYLNLKIKLKYNYIITTNWIIKLFILNIISFTISYNNILYSNNKNNNIKYFSYFHCDFKIK